MIEMESMNMLKESILEDYNKSKELFNNIKIVEKSLDKYLDENEDTEIKNIHDRVSLISVETNKLTVSLNNTIKYLEKILNDEESVITYNDSEQYIRDKVERRRLRKSLGIPD